MFVFVSVSVCDVDLRVSDEDCDEYFLVNLWHQSLLDWGHWL